VSFGWPIVPKMFVSLLSLQKSLLYSAGRLQTLSSPLGKTDYFAVVVVVIVVVVVVVDVAVVVVYDVYDVVDVVVVYDVVVEELLMNC
jgi:hypothetical protein